MRREPDPDDKRAAFAVITDDGRAALRKAAPVYLQGIEEEFLSHLTAGERKVAGTFAPQGARRPARRTDRADRSVD